MKYIGDELILFRDAINWKNYWSSYIRPYVTGRVLDAGCGIGVNSEYVLNDSISSYTFLEPDPDLLGHVNGTVRTQFLRTAEKIVGTTADLHGRIFDTILYLDVIEHIEKSEEELHRASTLLSPGGHLIILVPAYDLLFSDFDRAIGHYRRYQRSMILKEVPPHLECLEMRYLDSLGMIMSLGNKIFLRQSKPKRSQIEFWDRMIVPVSRSVDKLFLHSFGRSLLAVFRKPLNDGTGCPA